MLGKVEGRRRRGQQRMRDGHEFEQAPGAGDGLGSLVGCSPWDRKESDTTELCVYVDPNLLIYPFP